MALTGTLALIAWAIPVDAGMAIVLWIGLVISAQAFQAVPAAHAPAVVVGLLPGVAAWGAGLAKAGLRAAGLGAPGGPPFSAAVEPAFLAADVWIPGAFALEQGFIFTSMILAAAVVEVIERRFARAGGWMLLGAWPFAVGYLAVAALFVLAPRVTEPGEGHG